MPTLRDEARKERAVRKAAADAAETTRGRERRRAATEALQAVLGGRTLAELGLTSRSYQGHGDTAFWGDGDVTLAAREVDGRWVVQLVVQDSGAWRAASGPLVSLADLADALDTAGTA